MSYRENLIRVAFQCLQLVVTDFLPLMPWRCLPLCLETTSKFGSQTQELNISLTAIGLMVSWLEEVFKIKTRKLVSNYCKDVDITRNQQDVRIRKFPTKFKSPKLGRKSLKPRFFVREGFFGVGVHLFYFNPWTFRNNIFSGSLSLFSGNPCLKLCLAFVIIMLNITLNRKRTIISISFDMLMFKIPCNYYNVLLHVNMIHNNIKSKDNHSLPYTITKLKTHKWSKSVWFVR